MTNNSSSACTSLSQSNCCIRVKPLFVGDIPAKECTDKDYQWSLPVLVEQDNAALFEECLPAKIDDFLHGYNVNFLAFGQTGSGKSHSMFGPPGSMNLPMENHNSSSAPEYGIFPRALSTILDQVQEWNNNNNESKYLLTCSAVELSVMGNLDLFRKSQARKKPPSSKDAAWHRSCTASSLGVVLDKFNSTPPRLYGQTEHILHSREDIPAVFAAVASRNTAATQLNDSSSRSHCIITLTLWKNDGNTSLQQQGRIRRNRFQFCDLAGSERINDAFSNGMQTGKTTTKESEKFQLWQGVMTNWSLLELSRCLQDIAMARKHNKTISLRAYQTDLLFLLSGSLVGTASTTCICCVSQTQSNWSQTQNTVSFGKRFAAIVANENKTKYSVAKEESSTALQKTCQKTIDDNRKVLTQSTTTNANAKFRIIREAKVRDAETILDILDKLSKVSTI